ncbi:MAG: hypothetical protein JJE37_06685 [Methyloceanibacter sp.]|nr:hypothetical protein [Methyloceanibacter sp.]
MMQDPICADAVSQSRLFNPLLDFVVAGAEAQLKAWQAFQVEGTRFVAKRMSANLEHLRALGHCSEAQSIGECQGAWLHDVQKDYAEEWSRIVATTFAIGFADLAPTGGLFGLRAAQAGPETEPQPQPQPQRKLQAAA